MEIIDNTKEIHAKENFKVGDLVKSQYGHIYMITSDPYCRYCLVSLGDGSMSDPYDSIEDLFEEGYLDETDKKVFGFLTISDFSC